MIQDYNKPIDYLRIVSNLLGEFPSSSKDQENRKRLKMVASQLHLQIVSKIQSLEREKELSGKNRKRTIRKKLTKCYFQVSQITSLY